MMLAKGKRSVSGVSCYYVP